MSKIAIVLPIMNQFELAIKALDSVKTVHDWEPVIVNQWENPTSLAGAWNRGIKQAIKRGAEYILVSNDDVLYSPWTIDALVSTIEQAPSEVVMVTGCNNQGLYPDPNTIKSWPEPGDATTAESPDFSCYMIRWDFPLQVGPFDTNLFPAYYEDNEMHIRINVMGYKAICTTAAPYYHYGSRTQSAQVAKGASAMSHENFRANGQYLQLKWGTVDAAQINFRHPFNHPANDPRIVKEEWRPR